MPSLNKGSNKLNFILATGCFDGTQGASIWQEGQDQNGGQSPIRLDAALE